MEEKDYQDLYAEVVLEPLKKSLVIGSTLFLARQLNPARSRCYRRTFVFLKGGIPLSLSSSLVHVEGNESSFRVKGSGRSSPTRQDDID